MSACDSGALTPVDQAIATLLECAPAPPPVEQVALAQALGRVLAEDIVAPADVPAWDNSAMDGYALRAADLPLAGGWLPLAARIAAGEAAEDPLPAGHAVRIFTGAPLPPGADTVVAQENCEAEGNRVRLPAIRHGEHVRHRGEELIAGVVVLGAGKRLRPPELGLLASLGCAQVPVYRPLRVGLLSSGDELREPGEPLAPGQIYNANRYSVGAILTRLGCSVRDFGIVEDTLAATREALRRAAGDCDVLISSGGVSVGEEDHIKQAVRDLGSLQLWRLAIQPGKPMAFGEVAGTPWLGLPGNPAAALVTALAVARPFLLRAQGLAAVLPPALELPAGFDWPAPRTRRQYLRARLEADAVGKLCVVPHPRQGSAMLTAAAWSDGLAVIEAGRQLVRGEGVTFLPYELLLQ
ncbi:MAG: molybdenum cofactor biosynthetic protein [Moraxellaceae bacterium]|jgi:molybdopterin molybdotransferase|nr:molybdenum cofactor biosynthetic protein [Moraxellaceae bacterium]